MKEIMTPFGYLILTNVDFFDFISPFLVVFSFNPENILSNTHTLFDDHIFKHLEFCQKLTPLYVVIVFSALLLVFGNVIIHSLLCLIHYLFLTITIIYNEYVYYSRDQPSCWHTWLFQDFY